MFLVTPLGRNLYSIKTLLATYPPVLNITLAAQALGLTEAEVQTAIDSGHLVGTSTDGHWSVTRQSLTAQLEAEHTGAVPYSQSALLRR